MQKTSGLNPNSYGKRLNNPERNTTVMKIVQSFWPNPQQFVDKKVTCCTGLRLVNLIPLLNGWCFAFWQTEKNKSSKSNFIHLDGDCKRCPKYCPETEQKFEAINPHIIKELLK
jgi:hypothetical protein